MLNGTPLVSIVITTRNRCADVLRAVSSCYAQKYSTLEVLIFDDASTDDTVDRLRSAWPDTRIFTSDKREGYIRNRNRGFEMAKGDIVFSLDDDAYFSSQDIVSSVVDTFKHYDNVGAIAIPYVEPLDKRSVSSNRSFFQCKPGEQLRNYIGCAHAIRRDVAKHLNGYREFFVHQGEERDLCLRMLQAGWAIVYADSSPVVHMVSSFRDADRISYYGARNRILFNWLNLPLPEMFFRMVWDPIAIIKYRFAWESVNTKLRGIIAGYVESLRRFSQRQPVSRQIYSRFTRLPAHGPENWSGSLPTCAMR